MFSLQKFFCRDEKFFDLIEALAQSSSSSVKTLAHFLLHPGDVASVDGIVQKRRKSKELSDEIAHQLCVSFITPFEREDIEALTSSLTKISKTSEKFISQYFLFRDAIKHEEFNRQSQLLEQSADLLYDMVKKLRKNPNVEQIKEMNSNLLNYEAESDRIMLVFMQELFNKADTSMVNLLANKNLQELQEKLTERFRDAGNIVFRIVLKYS
jgi:uncharacterized protein Yka (UPF0111/DUF47 family)